MDMVLKVAKSLRTQFDEDWMYYSGFDTVDVETYWFVYVAEPAEKCKEGEVGRGPLLGLRCRRPGREAFETEFHVVENFIDSTSIRLLLDGENEEIPVKWVKLLKRNKEHRSAYDHVADVVLNTRAFLLGVAGQTIDRL